MARRKGEMRKNHGQGNAKNARRERLAACRSLADKLPTVVGVFSYDLNRLAQCGHHVGAELHFITLQFDNKPTLTGRHIVRLEVVQGVSDHVCLTFVAGALWACRHNRIYILKYDIFHEILALNVHNGFLRL